MNVGSIYNATRCRCHQSVSRESASVVVGRNYAKSETKQAGRARADRRSIGQSAILGGAREIPGRECMRRTQDQSLRKRHGGVPQWDFLRRPKESKYQKF